MSDCNRLRPPCFAFAVFVLAAASPSFAQNREAAPAVPTERAVTGVTPDRAFSHLFQDVMVDLRRLPSTDTLRWIGVGTLAATIGHTMDRSVSRSMSGSSSLDAPFGPGQTLGGAPLQLAGAFSTYAIGRIAGSGKVRQVGIDLMRAQIVSQAVTAAVKFSVRRTRPDGTQYSFPSGHTSVTFASATVLQRHLGWKAGIPAYAVASYVAASRIQEKRHFLSDVAFGAAVGIAVGRTITVGRGNARFALSPMATSGGGGVAFTLVGRD